MASEKTMLGAIGVYNLSCSQSKNCKYHGARDCLDGQTILPEYIDKMNCSMPSCPAGFDIFKEVGTRGKSVSVNDRTFEMNKRFTAQQ